jgi:hypothetical protein
MTNNTKKYKITFLLGSYNLEYIVDFPTSINTYSASSIGNTDLDRSKNKTCIIEPYYNGLSDHDAVMLTHINLVSIGRYYDDSSIREFKLNLSYEN